MYSTISSSILEKGTAFAVYIVLEVVKAYAPTKLEFDDPIFNIDFHLAEIGDRAMHVFVEDRKDKPRSTSIIRISSSD
jgi:hypothetical protein